MDSNGIKQFKLNQTFQMESNEFKWVQMVSIRFKCWKWVEIGWK